MIRVWDLELESKRWTASEVVTKCYCFPSSMLQRSTNPLPDSIRRIESYSDKLKKFNEEFDKGDAMSWNIVPLLMPPEPVLGRISTLVDSSSINPLLDNDI